MKEFSELRQSLHESAEVIEEHSILQGSMPPNILILRRKSVRQFPNHTMVALYYNDKLDQYFSIPYGGSAETTITPSSLKEDRVELHKDVMSHLRGVKQHHSMAPLHHADGTHTPVDPTTANVLLTVHDALKPEHQKKFAEMLGHSKPQFNKALDFAWKQVH